jgi:hypothetical protein
MSFRLVGGRHLNYSPMISATHQSQAIYPSIAQISSREIVSIICRISRGIVPNLPIIRECLGSPPILTLPSNLSALIITVDGGLIDKLSQIDSRTRSWHTAKLRFISWGSSTDSSLASSATTLCSLCSVVWKLWGFHFHDSSMCRLLPACQDRQHDC